MTRSHRSHGVAMLATLIVFTGSTWLWGQTPDDAQQAGPDARPRGKDRQANRQPPSAESMFKRIDKNQDGSIDLEEFRKALKKRMRWMAEMHGGRHRGPQIHHHFHHFDGPRGKSVAGWYGAGKHDVGPRRGSGERHRHRRPGPPRDRGPVDESPSAEPDAGDPQAE